MAASLDDVLRAIEAGNDILEEIRDDGAGGGSGGAAGKGEVGKIRKGSGGALKSLKSGIGTAMKGASAASQALDSLGITAGLRASNLGSSTGDAVLRGKRALLDNATSLPFAGFVAANTRQELNAQNDAQGQIGGLMDKFALAGGTRADINPAMLDTLTGVSQELNRNKHDVRQMVADSAARVGEKELTGAVGKDAGNLADTTEKLKGLNVQLDIFSSILRQLSSQAGGAR